MGDNGRLQSTIFEVFFVEMYVNVVFVTFVHCSEFNSA